MLSILIPIYNYDVRDFVKQLAAQGESLNCSVEIVCIDDCSKKSFQQINKEIEGFQNVRLIQSDSNLGRSAIRNALVAEANYENLLFLDCDGLCVGQDYLKKYAEVWDAYQVIYGGRVYNEEAPDDHDLYFHWYCGSNKEAILVEQRLLNPYKSFMTNNFLIRKEVYQAVRMDESVIGYGHEDTLFAQELKRSGFTIDHIDNPIEHKGIEPFDVFMEKSENGIRNLSILIAQDRVDSTIRLVRFYNRFRAMGLLGLMSRLVSMFEPKIMQNLKGPAPNLLWFDIWKLTKLNESK